MTDLLPSSTDAGLCVALDRISVTYRVRVKTSWRGNSTIEVPALQSVSLAVHRGECIGIIGRNGAGKSTLMRAIAGLMPLSEGRVFARSRPILVSVGGAMMPRLSGLENVELGLLALGVPPRMIGSRTDSIVEFSGLEDSIRLPLRTYSSGMVARLKFAIATSMEREVLLLDEALGAGDAEFRGRSADRIKELCDSAHAVFIVSHSMSTVARLCTRVAWLERGHLRADGATDEVVGLYREWIGERRAKKRERRRRGLGDNLSQPPDDGVT